MQHLHTVAGGYSCAAAATGGGWLGAALVIPDIDDQHLEELNRHVFRLRSGESIESWREALVGMPRRLVLVDARDGAVEVSEPAEAERIDGPAVAGGERPAVAWTQRSDGRWRLMLHRDGEVRELHASEGMLRRPDVSTEGELLIACDLIEGGREVCGVWDERGRQVLGTEGRNPRLGTGLVIVERASGNRSALVAVEIDGGREIGLPCVDDLNMNAAVAADREGGGLYVVWESAHSFGYNELVGAHRELNLWWLPEDGACFQPAPGTCRGRLALPMKAFTDGGRYGSAHNLTPVHPRVLTIDGEAAVAYRRFRFFGMKCYGWDTWLTRCVDGVWTEPARISPNSGHCDSRYEVVADGEGLVVLSPCCDQRPITTFAQQAAGEEGLASTDAARNHRVEVHRLARDERLEEPGYPRSKAAPYIIWPPVPGPAPEPPRPEGAPDGLELIWADLHAHSAYSKCMSANDGLPEDVLRLQRDALGCSVLLLTEHIEYMTAPEFAHDMDEVERAAGDDRIPLYAVEWAQKPAHHTNFYSFDRAVFEHLRTILLSRHDLREIFPAMKQELPEGSAFVIRHFHGMGADEFGVNGARVADTHDPDLEWAMEAMQTRGNMMVDAYGTLPMFPSNFLNAGARIGLIGGSDHSRGKGPNRFCLTGFWVPEVTAEAVSEAIRERRTLAMSNGKVAIWATLDGRPMGSEVVTEPPVTVVASVSSAYPLRRACLIRDGEPLEWVELEGRSAVLELSDDGAEPGEHWYCVTVEAGSAMADPPTLAHASPFFVSVT